MSQKLSARGAILLTIPPLLWAGNVVVGRYLNTTISPIALNALRWLGAFVVLLPLAGWVMRPGSGMWSHWKRFALLGLLGVGAFNALQYLALQTSTPLNITLVAGSNPFWTLLIGALFFKAPVQRHQAISALMSMCGVLLVLSRGDLSQLLTVRFVIGDLFMLLATACWCWYSWLLSRNAEPAPIRQDWAAFLLAQVFFGLLWSCLFSAAEWQISGDTLIVWGWPLVLTLSYIVIGPAVLAYRCWGLGIETAGPQIAGFFANLTPLFAALFSATFLGEMPHPYHGLAFALIVGGIWWSSRDNSAKASG